MTFVDTDSCMGRFVQIYTAVTFQDDRTQSYPEIYPFPPD
jgi:hypothetical protein